MMKSFFGTCSYLHQPLLCMHLFIQATLIHQFRTDITIFRSMVTQNRNNLITNLTFHLDNRFLMINLPIIQCYINLRNTLSNIPNCLCLLSTVYPRYATLMQLKTSPVMILAASPTLQRLLSITLVLLLILKSLSSFNCIEPLVWCFILIVICILRFSSFHGPLSFILLITYLILVRHKFVL